MSIVSQKRGAAIVLEASKSPRKRYRCLVAVRADDPLHAMCLENVDDFAGLERDLKLINGYDVMLSRYETMYEPHASRVTSFDVVLSLYHPSHAYTHSEFVSLTLTAGSVWARHANPSTSSKRSR
jgi:hypothetical protein